MIWYYLHNLKNMKNTPEGMLLLVKLKAKPAILVKVTFLHECFSCFLNCTNGIKLRNASHLMNRIKKLQEKWNGFARSLLG